MDKPLQDILDQNEAAWQKLRFTIASYESAALLWVNADTDIKLQNIHRAIQSDFPTRHHISIHLPPDGNIKPFAQYIISKAEKEAQTGVDTIVHIWGIDPHLTKEKQLLNQLNFERETLFRQLPFVAIVYANTNSALKVQRYARDFWDWLVNYFEFQTTPEELDARQKHFKDFVWLSDNSSLRIYDKDPAARIDQLKDELTQYQTGRKTDRIAILIAIAQEYIEVSDYPSVIAYFKEAIDLCGDDDLLVNKKIEAQDELGEVLLLTGHLDEALSYVEQNLLISQQINDRKNEGVALNNISTIYSAKGDYDTALRYLEQSLAIRQQIGDRKGESATLNNIGQIHQARGNYDEALRYSEMDLAICQQIGDRSGEGTTLNNLAATAYAKGDYDTALRYLEQSLAIRQQIGDRKGEGTTLNNISQIYDVKGDYDTALHYLEQSLAITQQIGNRSGEGTTLNNISQIYKARGDYDTALRYLEQSLAITQQIGDRSGEGTTLNNISQIYDAKGDYDIALRYLEQSLAIKQQIGDIAGVASTLHNMGCIFWKQQQDAASVVACFMQAYQIFTQIGSPDASYPESWLNHIKGEIGEDAFNAIVSAQGGAEN